MEGGTAGGLSRVREVDIYKKQENVLFHVLGHLILLSCENVTQMLPSHRERETGTLCSSAAWIKQYILLAALSFLKAF